MKYLILLLLTSITLFASIGKVVALRGHAYIDRESSKITIKLGSEILKKDLIITKNNAKLQIIFEDRTIITIGPESKFKVEAYVNKKNDHKAEFSMFRGTFKTITGKIGKISPKRFQIKTKSATIGIRGTQFIVVADESATQVICTQGMVAVADNIQNRSVEVPAGYSTQVTTGTAPQTAVKTTVATLQKAKAKLEPKKEKKKVAPHTANKQGSSDSTASDEDSNSEDSHDKSSHKKEATTDREAQNDETSDEAEDGTMQQNSQEEAPLGGGSVGSRSKNSVATIKEDFGKIQDSFMPKELPTSTKMDHIPTDLINTIVQDTAAKSVSDTIATTTTKKKETISSVTMKIPDVAKIPDTSPNLIHKDDRKLLIDENAYLSWGYWIDANQNRVDTYLDGISTAESIIQDYISTNYQANYSGDVVGLENGSTQVNGTFQMDVDFGANHIGITEFNVQGEALDWNVHSTTTTKNLNSAGIFNVNVVSTQDNSIDGTLQGQFYGSSAEAVGGNANLTSGNNRLDATFSGLKSK